MATKRRRFTAEFKARVAIWRRCTRGASESGQRLQAASWRVIKDVPSAAIIEISSLSNTWIPTLGERPETPQTQVDRNGQFDDGMRSASYPYPLTDFPTVWTRKIPYHE